jgi:hypothetical protein
MSKKVEREEDPPIDETMQNEMEMACDQESASQPQQRESKQADIPSPDDCLRALGKLPGLVALKVLKPAECNAIRTVYSTMLGHHAKHEAHRSSVVGNEDVITLLRSNPALIDLIAPILSAEQLNLVMQHFENNDELEA